MAWTLLTVAAGVAMLWLLTLAYRSRNEPLESIPPLPMTAIYCVIASLILAAWLVYTAVHFSRTAESDGSSARVAERRGISPGDGPDA